MKGFVPFWSSIKDCYRVLADVEGYVEGKDREVA
jgi:hypothetical protein